MRKRATVGAVLNFACYRWALTRNRFCKRARVCRTCGARRPSPPRWRTTLLRELPKEDTASYLYSYTCTVPANTPRRRRVASSVNRWYQQPSLLLFGVGMEAAVERSRVKRADVLVASDRKTSSSRRAQSQIVPAGTSHPRFFVACKYTASARA